MRFALSLWIEQLIKNNNFYRFQNTPTEKRGERVHFGKSAANRSHNDMDLITKN